MLWFYPIDWAATGSWMQAWSGLAAAAAVVYAARKGQATIASWLDQKRAERQLDIAEKSMTLAYKCRTALDAMRNPFHSVEEIASAERDLQQNWEGYANLTEALKSHVKTAQVVFDRSNQFSELWKALDESLAPAQAFLHEQVHTNLKELLGARRSILIAAKAYSRTKEMPRKATQDQLDKQQTRVDRYEALIFDGLADKDPLQEKIASWIEGIETSTRPILRGPEA